MELKILSFNIRCANDPDGHSIEERAPRVGQILRDYSPDVAGMQEFRPKWEPHWHSVVNEDYDQWIVDRGDGEGNVLLWRKDRFDALKKGRFWFADDPDTPSTEWDEKYHKPRICAYVVLQDRETGKAFTYMNVHYGFGVDGHIKNAQLMCEYSQKLGNYPVIISGDFNMTPDTPGYIAMAERFADVNRATDNLAIHTFHGYGKEPGRTLDYCFVSDSVAPVSYEVVTRTFDGKYPSDHHAICVGVRL